MCREGEVCKRDGESGEVDSPTPGVSVCTSPELSTPNSPQLSRIEPSTVPAATAPPPPALLTTLIPRPPVAPPSTPLSPFNPAREPLVPRSSTGAKLLNALSYLARLPIPLLPNTTCFSLRCEDRPDTFYLYPTHIPFALLSERDLLRIAIPSGKIVESGSLPLEKLVAERKVNVAAAFVHAGIYDKRRDVNAVMHGNSRIGAAFSAIQWAKEGEALESAGLDMISPEVCAFYKDVTLFEKYAFVLNRPEDALQIAESLGPRKAIFLPNQGILTVGTCAESCLWWFTSLERACHTQITAAATMLPLKSIPDAEASLISKFVGSEDAGKRAGKADIDGLLAVGTIWARKESEASDMSSVSL